MWQDFRGHSAFVGHWGVLGSVGEGDVGFEVVNEFFVDDSCFLASIPPILIIFIACW